MGNLPYPTVLLVIFFTSFLLFAKEVKSDNNLFLNTTDFHFLLDDSFTLQGDASVKKDGILSLTKSAWNTGRYVMDLDIWNKTSGNEASFFTSFSFSVNDYGATMPGGGFIFFLAPTNSKIPNNSGGRNLGVVDGNNAYNQFVGVEFDNYFDKWDPNYPHVGINVNSLISLKTIPWNRVNGSLVTVTITYDSFSKSLSVVVTDDLTTIDTVSQFVDLKAVLPEKVIIGFSATTGSRKGGQTHNVHSWYLRSFFKETTASTT